MANISFNAAGAQISFENATQAQYYRDLFRTSFNATSLSASGGAITFTVNTNGAEESFVVTRNSGNWVPTTDFVDSDNAVEFRNAAVTGTDFTSTDFDYINLTQAGGEQEGPFYSVDTVSVTSAPGNNNLIFTFNDNETALDFIAQVDEARFEQDRQLAREVRMVSQLPNAFHNAANVPRIEFSGITAIPTVGTGANANVVTVPTGGGRSYNGNNPISPGTQAFGESVRVPWTELRFQDQGGHVVLDVIPFHAVQAHRGGNPGRRVQDGPARMSTGGWAGNATMRRPSSSALKRVPGSRPSKARK